MAANGPRRSKRKAKINENEDLLGKKVLREGSPELEQNENFLSLNEDCWFEIFDLLTLKDLCIITKVCSQLKVLAKKYFRHKNQSKQFYVLVDLNDCEEKTFVQPKEDYDECFRSSISNVLLSIVSKFEETYQYPSLQILSRFSSRLKFKCEHVQFKWLHLHAQRRFDDIERNALSNLSTIIFWNCTFDRKLAELLRQCHQLKNLIIYMDEYGRFVDEASILSTKEYINDLFIRKYRMLERFQCYFGNGMFSSNEKWARFLRINPTIKCLTCYFNDEDTKGKLEAIVQHCTSLEEIFLSFRGNVNMQVICAQLLALGKRNNLNRIELNFYSKQHTNVSIEHVEELKSLNQLSGLHFSFIPKSVLNTVTALGNLKTLHLTSDKEHLTVFDMKLLASNLVNLEVFFWELCACSKCILYDFVDRVEPFVRLSFKLQKMYILNYIDMYDLRTLDLNHREFNQSRKQLRNASKLSILLLLADDEMRYHLGNNYDYDGLVKKNFSYFNFADDEVELVSIKMNQITHQFIHVEDPFIKSIWELQHLASFQ